MSLYMFRINDCKEPVYIRANKGHSLCLNKLIIFEHNDIHEQHKQFVTIDGKTRKEMTNKKKCKYLPLLSAQVFSVAHFNK